MASERCFLCLKANINEEACFESIEASRVPASNKPVQVVLQHLANCIKTKLVFQVGATVCAECFKELSEYDSLMLNLLTFQKRLTQQLQSSLSPKYEEEDEIMAIAEEEVHLEDAFNPELDTKEELIEIDNIIDGFPETIEVDEGNVDEREDDDEEEDDEEASDDGSDWKPRKRGMKQECVICGSTFKTRVQLHTHITEIHDTKTHSCTVCGAVCRDEEYLELHMNLHDGKTEKECRYCPKRFSRKVNTLRHMRKHWDKKKYQCEKCGERFSLDNMLYNHRQRHEAEENPLICSICNQSFKSRKTFNHHMLIHMENRPRHHCSICPKSFTERYTLKMHMKTHTDVGDVANYTVASETTTVPVVAEAVEVAEEEEVDGNETEAAVTALVTKFAEDSCKDYFCVICSTKYENKEMLEQHLQQDHDVILK